MSSIHISQNLKIAQTLSPNMIQSASILQMNAQELSEYLSELSLENPMVDLTYDPPAGEEEQRLLKLEWLAGLDEQNRAYYSYDREDSEDSGLLDNVSGHRTETLADLLRLQLLSGHYSPQEMEVFEYIISSLDEKGFFTLPVSHLAEVFGIPEEEAGSYLNTMRELEPDGICAAGPKDCLLRQIGKHEDWDVEYAIVSDHMEMIAKNKLPAVAKALGQPLERITLALERIRALNPYPAQGFDTGEALHYVTPDITVVKFPGHFEILLNRYGYPEIHVNRYYLKLLRSGCDKETKDYLSDKLRQIEQARENISRRSNTLLELAKFLLSRQEDFFLHGEAGIRPLKMKDAAQALEVHESTVSRAVKGKYLQCAWGLYPLNYFFSAGIANEDDEQVSARLIKAVIRTLVEEEDKKKPRSDQKLCDLLQEQGMAVSRRTVAKYREEMGIGSTRERKQWP